MRFRALLLGLLMSLPVTHTLADVCVWRDPERSMRRLFPTAWDYQTLTRSLNDDQRADIEGRLGTPLDPAERENWASYRIIAQDGNELGRVIACAQTGEYGAIEVVMGVRPDGTVHGVYVQRSRERANRELRSPAFLDQFVGRTVADRLQVGADIEGIPQAQEASDAVALAVRKMLLLYAELR